MNILLTQSLRKKLKRRAGRFRADDEIDTFYNKVVQFWNFFNRHSMFSGIVEELLPHFPNINQDVEKVFAGHSVIPESEEKAAALGYKVIQLLVGKSINDIHPLTFVSSAGLHRASQTQGLYEFFVEPLCNYIDEQLDNQSVMLSLLTRYKQRSEWFYRGKLYEKSQENNDSKRQEIEKRLAVDLYAYLYDEGVDFHIEPSSMPGAIDLIAAQDTHDPLLLDVKVFDNIHRNKSYLCKGFNQVYEYTQQYNEPFGYLVIFNIAAQGLRFSLKCPSHIPMVLHNNKTIFLFTIDINHPPTPPSKRGRLDNIIEILEEELIRLQTENSTDENGLPAEA
jgi:hypothetical protein